MYELKLNLHRINNLNFIFNSFNENFILRNVLNTRIHLSYFFFNIESIQK